MENHKMCNISKTTGRTAKRMEIWNSRVRSFEFCLGSFDTLCKISHVQIFKRLLLPQFSSYLNQTLHKACNLAKYKLLLFLAICQTLKAHGILKISYLSCIASIHKAMLVSSGKRSSRT